MPDLSNFLRQRRTVLIEQLPFRAASRHISAGGFLYSNNGEMILV